MVQLEVTVPEGSKEGELTTFMLADVRLGPARVLAGLNARKKSTVIILVPVPFHVVVPERMKAGNQIKSAGPDDKLRGVDSLAESDEGQTNDCGVPVIGG